MPRRYWRMFSVITDIGKMSEIGRRLTTVLEKIKCAESIRPQEFRNRHPRLVAVSKTKPVEDIIEAYDAGQRVFGENYVNELLEKASNPKLLELCPEIQWHFIGRLQRNKASKVARLTALVMVETLDSARLADTLNAARERADLDPLSVMVQVNTSDEPNKGGVPAEEAAALARHVRQECPALVFAGLMTIGAFNHDLTAGPNPDFQLLLQCRQRVASELGLHCQQLELSMGMSADYEHAIIVGSTNVRVGSEIFGARQYKTTAGDGAKSNDGPSDATPAQSSDGPSDTTPAQSSDGPSGTTPAQSSDGPSDTTPAQSSDGPSDTTPAQSSDGPSDTTPAQSTDGDTTLSQSAELARISVTQ